MVVVDDNKLLTGWQRINFISAQSGSGKTLRNIRHTELLHFRDILAQNKNKSQDTTTQSKFTQFHASRSLNYVYFQSIPCLFLFCVLSLELNLKTSSATSYSPKVFRNIPCLLWHSPSFASSLSVVRESSYITLRLVMAF